MGFGTVFATIMFVFIFASAALFIASAQKNMQEAASQQQERNQEFLRKARQDLTIENTDYQYGATLAWVDDLYEDFKGTHSFTTVIGEGSVELSPAPYQDGTYTSQAIDSGFSGSNYSDITWTSVEPADTAISFQLRTANTIAAVQGATFTGPDGTAGTYYTLSGSATPPSISPGRFIQYRAYLWTNDTGETPQLQDLRIEITRPSGMVFVNVTNSGSETLVANQTDLYVGTTRFARNESARALIRTEQTEQALWNPGESIELVAFHTIVSSQQVVVSNDAAKAAGSVAP